MTGESSAMPAWLRGILVCPVCHAALVDQTGPDGRAELVCAQDCDTPGTRRAYQVEDGIPVLLPDQARIVTA
jgi:uncharacterized protein